MKPLFLRAVIENDGLERALGNAGEGPKAKSGLVPKAPTAQDILFIRATSAGNFRTGTS